MAEIVVGPLLRYLADIEATVWVETDAACEVGVLGHRAKTFEVFGHHYAIVRIDGLEPDTTYEYEVALDGERRWPEAGSDLPASRIRTFSEDGPFDISFGSCRVALPHEPPYTLSKDQDSRGKELDALHVLATEMLRNPDERWPHLLLLLGDQVYADEGAPETREFIRRRRDTSQPPHEEVADFEEYTHLYRESWREPVVRWLLSTVSTSMVIDDHDVRDDWNISRSWLEDMRALPWWGERIIGAFMSYWLYQHLGNLSPRELAETETYHRVIEADGDAGEIVREYAMRCDEDREGVRWSFHRDLGRNRLIVMDSRAGRILHEGRRSMFDDDEWEWIREQAHGDFDHLLLATSDPYLLAHGMHYAEVWSEQVCNGAWGPRVAKRAEKLRRAVDLDHWAAFQDSFHLVAELLREVGAGERGNAPASIVLLSGDVHHAYLCEIEYPESAGVQSETYQAVCSPFRNPLDASERRKAKLASSRPAWRLTRALARAVGGRDPDFQWSFVEGPYFDNQVASLTLRGRSAQLKLEKTRPGDEEEHRLETSFERSLA
ncbi:MAG TPA: alkaline phosphatase D family protein [Solirubrobacterales bacterium]|nr:alkaline phosphatase D family protein [Solirubrobacterales bacterium]